MSYDRQIPQDFLDDLLSRTDIVEVIDARVPLRRAGSNFMACCPFHAEKTPSFTVSPTKQFYYCFGCGASGNALRFLMNYDRLHFVEAVEELARRAGVKVPQALDTTPSQDFKALYTILTEAARYFQKQLRHHPDARWAIDYLKGRGLIGKIAAEYGLGFAPPASRQLIQTLAGEDPDRLALLDKAGLIARDERGHHYDRFRSRVLFPIRNRQGQVIAFGGRALGDVTPKYLNSPETPVFHKNQTLYGIYEANKALHVAKKVLVVEGYLDVIALAQYGLRETVATLGTAVSSYHLGSLFRLSPLVICCFDGDVAGRKAAWRALENSLTQLKESKEIRFVFLPEGDDPDTFIRRESLEGFQQQLEQALSFSDFFFKTLLEGKSLTRLEDRARLVEQATPLIAQIPEGAMKILMTQQLGEMAKLPIAVQSPATEELAAIDHPLSKNERSTAPTVSCTSLGTDAVGFLKDRRHYAPYTQNPRPTTLTLVQRILALLLQNPELARSIEEPEAIHDLQECQPIVQLMAMIRSAPHQAMTQEQLLENWQDPHLWAEMTYLANLPLEYHSVEDQMSDLAAYFSKILQLQQQSYKHILLEKFRQNTITPDESQWLANMLRS